jgi:hypothetical protein
MWSVAEADTSWWWESAPAEPEPEVDEIAMSTPLDALPSTLIEPDLSVLSSSAVEDQSQLYAAFWGEADSKQRIRLQRLRSWRDARA